jgi:hypothetical protein
MAFLFLGEGRTHPSRADDHNSRAASLAGHYVLTITIDERCSQLPIQWWTYRATLADLEGYLSVGVLGGSYSEPTVVGRAYTFPDLTARIV